MRSLLTNMKLAMNSEYFNSEVPLLLLTFESDVLATPIRVVHNTEDIISNGLTFKAFPFECQLLNEQAGEVVSTSIKYHDIDQEMIALVRLNQKVITVKGNFVLASEPDNDQIPPFTWISLEESWNDKREVTLTVGPRSMRGFSWPSHKMDPPKFRSIFGGSVT